jgi:hypothetical protein
MVFKSVITNDSYPTPSLIYESLDKEFQFDDFDPCPLHNPSNVDGLTLSWKKTTFCNPPYSRLQTTKRFGIGWIEKSYSEALKGKTVILLLPVRSDTRWFHEFILDKGFEVRFIKNRLKFGTARPAPFPSCIVIMKILDDLKE